MPRFIAITHFDQVYVLPSICIMHSQCEDPRCGSAHYSLVCDWLIFGVAISF